jgi:hypothetical protein
MEKILQFKEWLALESETTEEEEELILKVVNHYSDYLVGKYQESLREEVLVQSVPSPKKRYSGNVVPLFKN